MNQNQLNEEEVRNSALRKTDSMSVLSESQGVIVETPDGTFFQGVPAKMRKSPFTYEEAKQNGDLNILENYPRNRILYIVDDDEIAVYSGFNQLPNNIDEFVDLYLRHAKYFTVGLIILMVVELVLWVLGYVERNQAISELMDTYKTNAQAELTTLYMSLLWCELGYIVMYYILGYLAVYRRSVRLYSWFATFSLIGLIFEMILAYINRFDIFIFIMRFIGFIYARFLNQLLISLLLLPR